MTLSRHKRGLPPIDEARLNELALRYVERFATTRAKLTAYLARKVRERGWNGTDEPDFFALASRFAEQGYIDDAAYALSKSRSLAGRGYGKRRLLETLRSAGVEEADSAEARDLADLEAVEAALRFAKKRRIGPFGLNASLDPKQREKALAAMIRAGHSLGLGRAIILLGPGEVIDMEDLAERARLNPA